MTSVRDLDSPFAGPNPKAAILRWLAGGEPFTIVSNNCWGAHVYQALGIPYATPFVGLFIPPKSYLRLLDRFDELIAADLTFTDRSESADVNAWRAREGLSYPIGRLGDCVEIDFQHYESEADAREKWRRRCARIVADPHRRFFKFDDREGAEPGDIAAFAKKPLANKVCFTARPYPTPTVVVPPRNGEPHVVDGVSLAASARARFNVLKWISPKPAWLPLPALV